MKSALLVLSNMDSKSFPTESNFLKYIKVTKELYVVKLAKHPYFTNLMKVG